MRTVLHLIDTSGTGGAETVYLRLVAGLDQARFRSVAAIPDRGWLSGSLLARGIQPVFIPSTRAFDLGLLWGIVRVVREQRVDLIQTHLLTSAVYAAIAGLLTGVPVVSTLHGLNDVRATYLSIKSRALRLNRQSLVLVSERLRADLSASLHLSRQRSHVIHNGVDSATFSPRRDLGWRRGLGIADDEVLIGGVGRIIEAKGFDVLLRAAVALRPRDRRYRFVVVGDPNPNDDELRRLLALRTELGLDQVVLFPGFVEDMPRVYASLDALAITSRTEGFSLVAVEAMASGLPVISTRCGGPEEIVTDGVDGLLIPCDDPDSLASAVERLFGDRELRAALVARARTCAVERFSLDSMVMQYEALYDALLRSTPSS